MVWNPSLYLKFHSARLRPAIDLLQKSMEVVGNDLPSVKRILDLGCGPGNITPFICEMFPNAEVHGVDSSKEMIDKATKSLRDTPYHSRTSFSINTIENVVAEAKSKKNRYDFVYANASLHWCVNHDKLLPDIVEHLIARSNGVLAIQMPDTLHQKSHNLMETAALRCGLIEAIKSIRIPRTDHSPDWYYKLLSPLCREVDIWTTEYVQQLPTYQKITHSSLAEVDHQYHISNQRHPVSDFTRATGLMPILQALGGEETERCQRYLDEYDRLLAEEYPSITVKNKFHSTGKPITLMPFKRFFLVCKT